MMNTFKYMAPASRAELHGLLADHGGAAKLLAGGTDLLGDIRIGLAWPELVVDLKKVDGFADVTWSPNEGLTIGPAVTINDVLRDPRIREHYPLLVACARDLASHQIRNRATVVGNIMNASPCSDMAPGLLCLGARTVISSARGRREIALVDLFTGVKETVLEADEVLEAIAIRNPRTMEALNEVMEDYPWRMNQFGRQIVDALRARIQAGLLISLGPLRTGRSGKRTSK